MNAVESGELAAVVNREARRRYPALAKQLGVRGLAAALPTRFALRGRTPYPYSFTEDAQMLPTVPNGFGRIIRKSRMEGMREIHSTISDQQKEHSWLFVPGISAWIDVTERAEITSVEPDQYLQIFLSHVFSGVEFVHTHPDSAARHAANEHPWTFSDNYLLESAQPSRDDLTRHLQMLKRMSPSARLVDSVVSHHGLTSFAANELAMDKVAFMSARFESRILNPSVDPGADIRSLLGRVGASQLLHEGTTPIFDLTFESLS